MQAIRTVVPPRDVPAERPDPGAVQRTLPERRLASIGAWCLVEVFRQPRLRARDTAPPAYPLAGTQALTWQVSGLVRHRDSLGTDVLVRPGRLALTTAGRGVTVAEAGAPDPRGGRHARRSVFGVHLTAALPSPVREQEPGFQDLEDLPTLQTPTMRASVLVGGLPGRYAGVVSPAVVHTPLVAVDIAMTTGTERLDLDPSYEHGVLVLDGEVSANGTALTPGALAYVPLGLERLDLATLGGCQVLLLGGVPYDEEFILWWNLLGSTHEQVAALRRAWARDGQGDGRFGRVEGVAARAEAPTLPPGRLRPRRGSLRSRQRDSATKPR